MKNPHIAINDHGELFLIDAPEKPIYKDDEYHVERSLNDRYYREYLDRYDQALASAIEGGVKFKDQQATFKILIASLFETDVPVPDVHPESRFVLVNKGKTFPLPSGFTAEVVNQIQVDSEWIDLPKWEQSDKPNYRKVALLLPSPPVVDTSVEPKEIAMTESAIVCPFCSEVGFDKIGLKYHLEGHCEQYNKTEVLGISLE